VDEIILRPFIRWAGGKQKRIKHLINSQSPKEQINKYWEPFLGAGSLFFANDFKNAERSDVNVHLINAYRHINTNPKGVYDLLQYHLKNFTVDYYYKLRSLYNSQLNENSIEQGAMFVPSIPAFITIFDRISLKGRRFYER
jgi:DNA adenine methylase